MIRQGELFKEAANLCKQAHLGDLHSLEQLNDGKNNQTFKLILNDGMFYIFKKYHQHPNDLRDRLGAEWCFLEYVWSIGGKQIPEPIIKNKYSNSAIYAFVNGKKLNTEVLTSDHIKDAANFIVFINSYSDKIEKFSHASEACFSLYEHVAIIDKRINRLGRMNDSAPYKREAEIFISDALVPAWENIRKHLTASYDYLQNDSLKEFFLSPSDFGFHNILCTDTGHLNFIDFEYSGRDDLAKLTNDFLSCPEIQVPNIYKNVWIETIVNQLPVDERFAQRVHLLENAYQIKWICIILNEFVMVDADRRDFATQQSKEERCKIQLEKAYFKMSNLSISI